MVNLWAPTIVWQQWQQCGCRSSVYAEARYKQRIAKDSHHIIHELEKHFEAEWKGASCWAFMASRPYGKAAVWKSSAFIRLIYVYTITFFFMSVPFGAFRKCYCHVDKAWWEWERESERKQTERRLPLCKICRSFGIVNVSRSASCCQIFKSHTNCPATMHEHNKINESRSGVECRSRHEILMWLHTQIAPRKKNSKVFFTLLRFSILKSTCSKLSCLPLLFSAFSRHEVWESGPETPLGQQRTPAHGKYISRWWSMFDCESSTRGECFRDSWVDALLLGVGFGYIFTPHRADARQPLWTCKFSFAMSNFLLCLKQDFRRAKKSF